MACFLNTVQLIPNYMITISLGNINSNIHTEIANKMYYIFKYTYVGLNFLTILDLINLAKLYPHTGDWLFLPMTIAN